MEEEKKWIVRDMECEVCTYKWIAVFPYDIEDNKIECSNCGKMNEL